MFKRIIPLLLALTAMSSYAREEPTAPFELGIGDWVVPPALFVEKFAANYEYVYPWDFVLRFPDAKCSELHDDFAIHMRVFGPSYQRLDGITRKRMSSYQYYSEKLQTYLNVACDDSTPYIMLRKGVTVAEQPIK